MKAMIVVAMLLPLPAMAAIYKCKVGGVETYQQAPCHNGASSEVHLDPRFSGGNATPSEQKDAPAPDAASDKPTGNKPLGDWIAQADRESKIRDLRLDIAHLKAENKQYEHDMDGRFLRLRAEKLNANNNLAGAAYEASISQEMQAVASQYQAKIQNNNKLISDKQDEMRRLQSNSNDVKEQK